MATCAHLPDCLRGIERQGQVKSFMEMRRPAILLPISWETMAETARKRRLVDAPPTKYRKTIAL